VDADLCIVAIPAKFHEAAALEAAKPALPGSKHAALADFLCRNTLGGAMLRRLHPAGAAG